MLDVGDGHQVFWSTAGNPEGKPALLLHGGPGAGSTERHRRLFNPERYLLVQFDQRNCGRSTPPASEPVIDLSTNTTQHLIADVEALRAHLDIDRWLVWGGSWGTTLALAYAEAHADAVTELLLSSVTTTTASEVEWITREMGRFFPSEWRRFCDAVPPAERGGNLAVAFNRMLVDADQAVHSPAAQAWCEWEDIHVSLAYGFEPWDRYEDPAFRLCFARLVTHYWANAGFLEADQLVRDAAKLGSMPVFLAHGRLDISSPVHVAAAVADACENAELYIAEREGHGGSDLTAWTIDVTDRLAG